MNLLGLGGKFIVTPHLTNGEGELLLSPPDSLIAALEIIFMHNYFKLGDSFWKQISGTSMGVCPAPPWATLFFALLESRELPKWASCILQEIH